MSDIEIVVSFGGGALLVFAALYAFHLNGQYKLHKNRGGRSDEPSQAHSFPFSITFARLYGLIAVAVVGALLAFSSVAADLATAAFTLLGTVAGYLAGASPTTVAAGGSGAETEPLQSGGSATDGAGPTETFL